jgi:hypothetical protein
MALFPPEPIPTEPSDKLLVPHRSPSTGYLSGDPQLLAELSGLREEIAKLAKTEEGIRELLTRFLDRERQSSVAKNRNSDE